MEQNPSKSILCKKCLKKLLLTSGIVLFLLMQNAISLVAGPALKVSGSDAQQKVTVTGRVVDANSEAMPMVNVLEKGPAMVCSPMQTVPFL